MSGKLYNFVSKYPLWIILVCITLVFFSGVGAQKLVFKEDYRIFFNEDNPQLIAYESMQKIYSKSDNVAFIVAPNDGNVFTAEHLAALKALTKASWQVPYSSRVDSITNFQHTFAEGDDMIVEDLVMSTNNLSAKNLTDIKTTALNEPLLVNKIVSETGHVSVVNVTVQLPGIDPMAETPEVTASVREIKARFEAKYPEIKVYLSGMVIMNAAFGEATLNDSATLIPLMFLVVIVSIGLLLRTITGTIATVFIIIISIVTTLGLAGWLGFYISAPSASAPTMIMTLAVADCIHILTSMFYEMRQGADKRTALARSIKVNFQPILLTSVTTAIGFLSMNFSDSPPFRDLGNLVAMGVMLAFVFSITIFPALLTILPIKVKIQPEAQKDTMAKLADFVIAKRKFLLIITSSFILISAAFIQNNELNDDFVKYFDDRVPYRTATDFMQENLSGMMLVEVSVKTDKTSGINNPNYLQSVSDFSDWLRTLPQTDHVDTITDTLKRLNKNMHGDDPSWHKLPDNQEMSAQYLLLYEMSLPYGLDLNNQLNVDKSSSRVVVTFKNMTSNELINIENQMSAWFEQHAPHYSVDFSSPSLMFAHIGQRNINSMLVGTVLALILISVLLGFALKSWRFGFISLLPNLAPATLAFGIWGVYSGEVGLALSVVIGMTLGIVVDDAVHFLSKYLHAMRDKGLDAKQAVQYAFDNVGRALWITTLVLVAGFMVLAQSSFKLNSDMGLLTAITIFLALIVDFLFLPPLLMTLDKRKKDRVNDKKSHDDESLARTATAHKYS